MSAGQSFPSSPNEPNATAAPGQRLKAEREHRGLSTAQIAEDLHVGVETIEALEAGRFESLGAPVYAKGHLRKYARLLGLDADALLAAYETTQAPAPELVPLKPAARDRRFRISRTLIVIVTVAIVAAAAGWFLASRGSSNPAPGESANSSAKEHAPAAEVAAAPAQAVPGTSAPATVTPVPRALTATSAAGGTARLRMTFTADSWVEIYDASEQRVFFDMGTTGTSRSVAAQTPLRVFLGFADGVQLQLDGRDVTLPPEARRGNLAEFSLDARGHLRPKR